mmetsp:Transcript_100755/g.204335  ORF Transcript_100755/g.204335 Transcript_100755/m.204335 type:complete len:227 (+) Transcript_100755:96-776(+)
MGEVRHHWQAFVEAGRRVEVPLSGRLHFWPPRRHLRIPTTSWHRQEALRIPDIRAVGTGLPLLRRLPGAAAPGAATGVIERMGARHLALVEHRALRERGVPAHPTGADAGLATTDGRVAMHFVDGPARLRGRRSAEVPHRRFGAAPAWPLRHPKLRGLTQECLLKRCRRHADGSWPHPSIHAALTHLHAPQCRLALCHRMRRVLRLSARLRLVEHGLPGWHGMPEL